MSEEFKIEQPQTATPFEGHAALPVPVEDVSAELKPRLLADDVLSPKARAELRYQKELALTTPGSPRFRDLKRSHRSMRVYNQHAVYWPTGRDTRRDSRRR